MTNDIHYRTIREALPSDMTDIQQVIAAAKEIMRSSGNMLQWQGNYPSEEVLLADMERHGGFVLLDDGRIVGYFAFLPSPDPTYSTIYQGEWLDDTLPYHVIHRIASYPDAHHIFASILDYCFAHDPNLRIDTHRDNAIMQHVLLRYGFTYCGIIYLANGDERLAYQKIIKYNPMEMNKLLDFAIRDFESAQGGFKIGDKTYLNYMSNQEWESFKRNMPNDFFLQYQKGSGNEIKETKYPPKMASFGSSSRLIYELSKDIPDFIFEKKLNTLIGGKSNLDGYLIRQS